MSDDNMPYRYNEDKKYPLSTPVETLPYDSLGEPLFRVGDMVQWTEAISTSPRSPWAEMKRYAIVREAHWILVDLFPIDGSNPRDAGYEAKVPYYIPEYNLYWNDGETSNTSQDCLELVSEIIDVSE